MSIRADDIGRITLHDSHNREVPSYATPEALAAQTAEYLARGGHIQQLPMGVSAQGYKDPLRPDKPKYASAMARTPKASQQILLKRKIKTEDGL